jgi:hypothetical protein
MLPHLVLPQSCEQYHTGYPIVLKWLFWFMRWCKQENCPLLLTRFDVQVLPFSAFGRLFQQAKSQVMDVAQSPAVQFVGSMVNQITDVTDHMDARMDQLLTGFGKSTGDDNTADDNTAVQSPAQLPVSNQRAQVLECPSEPTRCVKYDAEQPASGVEDWGDFDWGDVECELDIIVCNSPFLLHGQRILHRVFFTSPWSQCFVLCPNDSKCKYNFLIRGSSQRSGQVMQVPLLRLSATVEPLF